VTQPTIEDLLHHASCLRELARSLLPDEHAAEDLVQDTWVAALQGPPQNAANLAAWLRTVASRLFYKRQRREGARRTEGVAGSELLAIEAGAEGRARLWSELSNAVLELREPYRSVVVQRFYENLPPREIARRTATPLNTVNSQLKRGLAQLRQRLERDGGKERWVPALIYLAGGRDRALPLGATAVGTTAGFGLILSVAGGTVLLLALAGVWMRSVSRARETGAIDAAANAAVANTTPVAATEIDSNVLPTSTPQRDARQAVPEARDAGTPSLPDLRPSEHGRGVHVTVVDASGVPVRGATVLVGILNGRGPSSESPSRVAGETIETGEARVAINDKDIGSYRELDRCVLLSATALGHVDSPGYYVPPPDDTGMQLTIALGAGLPVPLHGRVVDRENYAIEGATVRIEAQDSQRLDDGTYKVELGRSTPTAADGTFRVSGTKAGRYQVRTAAPGYAPDEAWFEPGRAELVIRLSAEATLHGIVRDRDGQPVSNATVFVEPALWQSATVRKTQDDGSYELDSIPPGIRFVWALAADGERVAFDRIPFASGADLTWNAVVENGPCLRFACVDEDDAPLPHVLLQVERPHESQSWLRLRAADDEGRLVLVDCPDGPFDVRIYRSAEAARQGEPPVHVVHGIERSTEVQTIIVPAGGDDLATLTGFALDEHGSPFGEAVFFLLDETATRPFPADGATGRFVADAVAPGTYDAAIFCARFGTASLGELLVEHGGTIDLGTLRLPALGTFALEWDWPADHTFELEQLLDGRLWNTFDEADPDGTTCALLPGTYRATVKRNGGIVERRHVEVRSNENLTLRSGPRRRIEVTVRAEAGGAERATLGYVREGPDPLALEGPEPRELELTRRPDGTFTHVLALYTGGWRFTLSTPTGRNGTARIELKPGRPPAPVSISLGD
jgi:RNA polymerase sigma-70 factor (ECF subfamily)